MPGPVIRTRNLTRVYHLGGGEVHALRGVDLTVEAGELVAIMGSSGSGKSTLMNLLGALDVPTSGVYELDGVNVDSLSRNALADLRNSRVGFVFQQFHLLPRTSALENVALPLLYDRSGRTDDPQATAARALRLVGLGDRLQHEPSQLSGGQQQRVAIARALVNRPALLLADEPTGNLDSRTSVEVMGLLQQLNDEGITVVIVTHEADIATCTRRVVELRDGEVVRDEAILNGQHTRVARTVPEMAVSA